MSSAAAVLRSACYALRRPPFSCVLAGRQPLQRRFYSADCTAGGKPAETNTATVKDSLSRELDEINRVFDETDALLMKYGELLLEKIERERRKKVIVRSAIFAGVLAAIYVKYPFFGGTKEDKETMSTGNK